MRISDQQRFNSANSKIEQARSNNAVVLDKLATQKQVKNISDSPQNIHRIFRSHDQLKLLDTYQRNISFSKGYLERSESAIADITDALIRAKELLISVSSDTKDANSRALLVPEIDQLLNGVISSSNSTYSDRYIFSGFRVKTPTISEEGIFSGDDGVICLPTDKNINKQINLQARYLFEPTAEELSSGHIGLIDSFKALKQALATNDKQTLLKLIPELDYQLEKTFLYRTKAGALLGSLEKETMNLDLKKQQDKEQLSLMEDVDIFETSSDFKRTDTILQSALTTCNKMIEPSLLSIMK